MIITCSWCREHMGAKAPLDDESVTHTICDDCLREQERLLSRQEVSS